MAVVKRAKRQDILILHIQRKKPLVLTPHTAKQVLHHKAVIETFACTGECLDLHINMWEWEDKLFIRLPDAIAYPLSIANAHSIWEQWGDIQAFADGALVSEESRAEIAELDKRIEAVGGVWGKPKSKDTTP